MKFKGFTIQELLVVTLLISIVALLGFIVTSNSFIEHFISSSLISNNSESELLWRSIEDDLKYCDYVESVEGKLTILKGDKEISYSNSIDGIHRIELDTKADTQNFNMQLNDLQIKENVISISVSRSRYSRKLSWQLRKSTEGVLRQKAIHGN
ncbi:MAG: hypothetical protein HWD92_03145 [Flavobacteriia bacterium]|nr:hypothetical protein [Flavobacteriia bacterium]